MIIIASFDGRYSPKKSEGMVAFIVKWDILKKGEFTVMACMNKKVHCRNGFQAEIIAAHELISYINELQADEVIPLYSQIIILGDCQSLIYSINNHKYLRGIEPSKSKSFFKAYNTLIINNMVSVQWISRNDNFEADLASRNRLDFLNKIIEGMNLQ